MTAHLAAYIVLAVMWTGLILGTIIATRRERADKRERDARYQQHVRSTYGGRSL